MTDGQDAELVEAARGGDREAFGALVVRHQRMVEAVAYAAAGDGSIVEDVVQDTFVIAWRQLDRLREVAHVRPWLRGIASNVARKARRRRKHEATMVEVAGGETPFDAALGRERAREVSEALASLSARYREPLVLFYYEQCSVKEVAEALAIREDAAMQRLSRGRRKLGEAVAARVEESLERRPSRTAAGLVLAMLPLVQARRAVAAGKLASGLRWVATTTATATATLAGAVAAVFRAIAARWRIGAATLATAAIALVFIDAVKTSESVAAKRSPDAIATHDTPPRPAATLPPHLPDAPRSSSGQQIHRAIAVASLDPVETCRRGVRGLVLATLGKDSFAVDNGRTVYAPDPTVEHVADELEDKIGETCGGAPWPELYVVCDGTAMDVLDGSVNCSPYDPFD